jgi:hypothetical protein
MLRGRRLSSRNNDKAQSPSKLLAETLEKPIKAPILFPRALP